MRDQNLERRNYKMKLCLPNATPLRFDLGRMIMIDNIALSVFVLFVFTEFDNYLANPACLWDSQPKMLGTLGTDFTKTDQISQVFIWFTGFFIFLCDRLPMAMIPKSWWNLSQRNMKTSESEKYLVRFVKSEQWPSEKWLLRPDNIIKFWQAPLAPWHVWRPI